MLARFFLQVWKASDRVVGGHGILKRMRRLRFVAYAWRYRTILKPLLQANPSCLLGRTVAARPDIFGFVVAPYICKNWDAAERMRAFVADINTADQFGPLLNFELDHQIDLMSLDHLGPDFWLVMDKPIWFYREGVATLNLFREQVRLFTIAFSIQPDAGELVATIGGIQGRNVDNMLDLYRDMTKASAGMRPRDLIIELFRILCRHIGVSRILAVSDSSRHHRSPFFQQETHKLTLNYDEVWSDRRGEQINTDFFQLPIARQDRDGSEIPAKKRALYRKRYELLDRLEVQLGNALSGFSAHPISRKE